MTKPTFPATISWGSMMQAGVMLVAIAVGWATLDERVKANAADNNKSETVHDSTNLRLRYLETQRASGNTKLESIVDDVQDIGDAVEDNRKLLLQILQKD